MSVEDTDGQPWEVHSTEPTQHGVTLHRGYPQGERSGGPPQVIPTPELIELLWRIGSEDALRTLPISRGAITRLRRRYGITTQTQRRRMAALERQRQAHRLPDAQPLAVLAAPDASRHDPSPDHARLLIDELQQRLHGRTAIAERLGMDYLRVVAWSEGDAGMSYPEQYAVERLIARGRLISTLADDGHPTPERIRDSREAAGITVTRAAQLVRTAPKFWHRWEDGERPMPLHRWELWCYKIREEIID